MIIHILACVSDEGMAIYAKAFRTLDEAEDAMIKHYESEKAQFDLEDRLESAEIGPRWARVTYGDGCFYDWQILHTELK